MKWIAVVFELTYGLLLLFHPFGRPSRVYVGHAVFQLHKYAVEERHVPVGGPGPDASGRLRESGNVHFIWGFNGLCACLLFLVTWWLFMPLYLSMVFQFSLTTWLSAGDVPTTRMTAVRSESRWESQCTAVPPAPRIIAMPAGQRWSNWWRSLQQWYLQLFYEINKSFRSN